MSNLTGGGANNGRAQNGGSRTAAGPEGVVPVPPYVQQSPGRVRTPTEIMKARADRERLRENERRKAREEEEARRREREEQENIRPEGLPDSVGVAETEQDRTRERRSRDSRGNVPSTGQVMAERRTGERGSGGSTRPSGPQAPPQAPYQPPTGREDRSSREDPYNIQPPKTRSRRSSEPRPVDTRRTPLQTRAVSNTAAPPESINVNASQTRQTSRPAGLGGFPPDQPSGPEDSIQGSQQRSTRSSFPHAFERWENLSAHWEGLTSFWIRRLEQNREELSRGDLNQQLARQVTDLSAAGANLFHAVVELQRLRASSERKFQRWFFETRAEQERAREIQGKLEEQLRNERQAQMQATTDSAKHDKEIKTAYAAKNTADVQVREIRRELTIAKDEARRAWEELGRMVQEERDRTQSLKNGEPTLVGGVQVVPMLQGMSRQGSLNRPPTRDGPPHPSSRQVDSGSRREEPTYTSYDPARSETDTDPFIENGRSDPQVRDDPNLPSGLMFQQTSDLPSNPARGIGQSGSSNPQGIRTTTTTTTTTASGGGSSDGGYPGRASGRSTQITSQPGSTSFYQHEGSSLNPDERGGQVRISEGDERSYVPSVEDTLSEDEWSLDSNGQIRMDANGNPILSRRPLGSEDSDEYNVQEQLEREQMYGQRYGSGNPDVEYGSGPTGGSSGGRGPDYPGSGYGLGWEAMPRHHHPTRLSDVLEEDERSRTSPSRASQTSRGIPR